MVDIGKKTVLARILSGENVNLVVQSNLKTAYFDLKTRTIKIPDFLFEDENFEIMVTAHEISHCIYTPYDEWMKFLETIPNYKPEVQNKVKSAINIIEDVRVDRLIQLKYPGLKKHYNRSTDFIDKIDFFKIKTVSDIDKLSFLNRLCVYSKYDSRNPKNPYKIKFSSLEMKYVERAFNTDTFGDVAKLTKEIIEKFPMDDESFNLDEENSEESNDNSKTSNKDSNENPNGNENLPERMNIDEESFEKESDQKDMTESDSKSSGCLPTNKSEKLMNMYDLWELNTNKTPNISISNSYMNKDSTLEIKEIKNFSHVDFKQEHKGNKNVDLNSISNLSREFTSYVNLFANRFNQKKRAKELTNNNIRNTGLLDTLRVHKYKYDENIFASKIIENNQKNHGFIFLIDCSGSMANIFPTLSLQLFAFYKICEKIDVPFVFYGYTTNETKTNNNIQTNFGSHLSYYKLIEKGQQKRLIYENFYNIMNGNLLMGGTPTSDALLGVVPEIKRFKEKYSFDILNLIVLTDGADGVPMKSNMLKFNGTYYKNSYSPRGVVDNNSAIYRMMRDHYDLRITHIDITNMIPQELLSTEESNTFHNEHFLKKTNFGGANNVFWIKEKLIQKKDTKIINSLVDMLA